MYNLIISGNNESWNGSSFELEQSRCVREYTDKAITKPCFYDDFYKAQLARPSLDLLLQKIYREQSDLIVVFIGTKYQEKDWCGIEFRAVQDLLKARQSDRIMYVKMDDGPVDGVPSNDGFIDGRNHTPSEVADFIEQRIKLLKTN